MNAPSMVGVPQSRGPPPPPPPQQQQQQQHQLRPDEYQLSIRQEPERAKVVLRGKEKDRKPIDPPPIVQLRVWNEYDNSISFLHNPYYFCCCSLYEANRDQPKQPDSGSTGPVLSGSIVSSLHRLKDLDNSEGGYFVFGDLSAGVQGKFRLHFSLYEYRPSQNDVVFLKAVTSQPFEVASPKDWDGVKESTILSRSFADQGVRLRLRKESRNAASKRNFMPQQPSGVPPATPLRPLPSQTGSFGSHSSGEGGEPAYKRQRSYPASSLAMTYPGQMAGSQAYGSTGAYAPVPGSAPAGQGYPSMSQSAYGSAPFNFQPNQYATGYNPYSQGYGMQSASYRPQPQPSGDSQAFMSPFTSPAGQPSGQQYKQEPGSQQQQQPAQPPPAPHQQQQPQLQPQHQQQQPQHQQPQHSQHQQQQQQQQQQQPQYGSGVPSSYSSYNSSYPNYSSSSAYPGPTGPNAGGATGHHAQSQPQQQASSSYNYYGASSAAAPPQYSAHGSAASRGAMSNPASTPHLPPIQRPGEPESGTAGSAMGGEVSYSAR